MKKNLVAIGLCSIILLVSFSGCVGSREIGTLPETPTVGGSKKVSTLRNTGSIYGETPDTRTLKCPGTNAVDWSYDFEVQNRDGPGGIAIDLIDNATAETVAQASSSEDYAIASVSAALDPSHTYELKITSAEDNIKYDGFYSQKWSIPK